LTPYFLLAQPAVQKELGLSAEQRARLNPLVDFLRKPSAGEDLANAEKEAAGILQPDQASRLKQFVRQARGPQAMLEPDAAETLGLTEKQKETIRSLLSRGQRDPWRRGPPPGGPPGGRPRPRPGPPPEPDGKQINEQVLQVLRPEQRAAWQQMLGEPFPGDLRFGPPPRGPMGPDHGR
jgi:hypothetical protein